MRCAWNPFGHRLVTSLLLDGLAARIEVQLPGRRSEKDAIGPARSACATSDGARHATSRRPLGLAVANRCIWTATVVQARLLATCCSARQADCFWLEGSFHQRNSDANRLDVLERCSRGNRPLV